MVRLNLDEQEQISKLKYFWRDYGKYVIGFLLVVIIAYSSSELLTYRYKVNAQKAAVIYSTFTDAVSANDIKNVYLTIDQLQREYPKTEYTTFATMWAAKIAFNNHDLIKSSDYLKWLISNTRDKSMVEIAKLRLADIYIDQKNTKDALSLMMDKTTPEFQALFYAKRGDIYLVLNNKLKAIDAYKAALDSSSGNQELAQALQMKLDVLGN
ncbi:MAG: YfgM family protein [Neisseriaceae bacterium]|jgi:predicted negative regulator of RcsB-dependent stress response